LSRAPWLSALLSTFFFSSRRRHTRFSRDWSSDVSSSDLKLSTDPLYPGVLRALRGSHAPVLDLGCGLGLLAHALRQDGQEMPYRSEERRVGKECRGRWSPYTQTKEMQKATHDVACL